MPSQKASETSPGTAAKLQRAYRDQLIKNTFAPLVSGAVSAIARFEGKRVEIIDDELGQLMGREPGGAAVAYLQRIRNDYIPTNPYHIEILAEVGAQRGFLSRTWGEKLLRAARYYDAESLIERLWPHEPAAANCPPHVCHNLPAPTYGQFVMRTKPFNAVVDALAQRTAVVVLVSLGGMGKSSLVREIAGRCLIPSQPSGNVASSVLAFESVVWVSDQDQPGRIFLTTVLDEIAYTLDYPGLTRFEPGRKRREIDNLLKARRVLLIIDNFERVDDESLLKWLLRLPGDKSKSLIITRKYRHEFQQGAWHVEMGGMTADEAGAFIAERSRQLNVQMPWSEDIKREVLATTGGNPKVIDTLLGLVKRTGQTVSYFTANLHAAPDNPMGDLFQQSWSTLSQDARHVLLALVFFPTSVSDTVLATVTDLPADRLLGAIEQLWELALIETIRVDDATPAAHTPRRLLHPLTRQFAEEQLAHHALFAGAARDRWLAWAVSYARQFGYLFQDIARFRQMDDEEPTLAAALAWAFRHERYAEVIQLARGIEFYYYVRVQWGKKLNLHAIYIEAAERSGDVAELINALAMHIQLLSRQGTPHLGDTYFSRLCQLGQHRLDGQSAFSLYHTQGLYALATGDLHTAEQSWCHLLDHAAALQLADHMILGAQHWLATCRYRQGRTEAARVLYQATLDQARGLGSDFDRMVARNQIHLALLDLDAQQDESARERLEESQQKTEEHDGEQRARILQAQARLQRQAGQPEAARTALCEAITLFERMGLTDETASACEELDRLNAHERALGQT